MGRASLPVVLALALSPACGAQLGDPPPSLLPPPGKGDGGGSGASGSATPISATRFFMGTVARECDEAYACQDQFPSGLGYAFADYFGTNRQLCIDNLLQLDGEPWVWESEIASGRIGYDGGSADTCVHELAFGDCASFFHQGPVWSGACYQIFAPHVAQGGGCQLDASCTTGTCDASSQTCK